MEQVENFIHYINEDGYDCWRKPTEKDLYVQEEVNKFKEWLCGNIDEIMSQSSYTYSRGSAA